MGLGIGFVAAAPAQALEYVDGWSGTWTHVDGETYASDDGTVRGNYLESTSFIFHSDGTVDATYFVEGNEIRDCPFPDDHRKATSTLYPRSGVDPRPHGYVVQDPASSAGGGRSHGVWITNDSLIWLSVENTDCQGNVSYLDRGLSIGQSGSDILYFDAVPGSTNLTVNNGPLSDSLSLTRGAGKLVALGDSFASGEGAYDYTAGTNEEGVNHCHRSRLSYPHVAGAILGGMGQPYDVTSVACSGAVAENVLDEGGNGPAAALLGMSATKFCGSGCDAATKEDQQIDKLREIQAQSPVDVVTLGVGGNDAGFADVLTGCIIGSNCVAKFDPQVGGALPQASDATIAARVKLLLGRIHDAAPQARIILVGYPVFVGTSYGDGCVEHGIGGDEAEWIRGRILDLNRALEGVAREADSPSPPGLGQVDFLSLDNVYGNHVDCNDGQTDNWMHQAELNGPPIVVDGVTVGFGTCIGKGAFGYGFVCNESFHPTAEGQLHTGEALARCIEDRSFCGSASQDTVRPPWALIDQVPNMVSVGSNSMVEGDTGAPRTLKFPITLSTPWCASGPPVTWSTQPHTVRVRYSIVSTASDTATMGVRGGLPNPDYKSTTGVVNFKTNTTTGCTGTRKYALASVYPDSIPEDAETFSVILTEASVLSPDDFFVDHSLPFAQSTGMGLIIDDDDETGPVRVSAGDGSVLEGNAIFPTTAVNNATIPITLSAPAPAPLSVTVSVAACGGPGCADVVSDFKKAFTKTVNFKTGQRQANITIGVVPDLMVEGNEIVTVTLSSPVGVTIGRSTGILKIMNDDW